MPIRYTKLIDELNLSDGEKEAFDSTNRLVGGDPFVTQASLLSAFYLNRKFSILADKLINSNERLSKSNEKYARAMAYLTGALVFVGLLQFIGILLNK